MKRRLTNMKFPFLLSAFLLIGIQFILTAEVSAQQNPEYHTLIFSTNLKLDENGEITGAVKFEMEGVLADSLKEQRLLKGREVLDQFVQERLPGWLILRSRLMEEGPGKFVITAQVQNSNLVNWGEEGNTMLPALLGYRPLVLEKLKNYPDGVYSEVIRLQIEVTTSASKIGLPPNFNFLPEGSSCTMSYTPFVSNGLIRVISKVGYRQKGDAPCKSTLIEEYGKVKSDYFRLK